MQDIFGKDITVGAFVAYPTRTGSNMAIHCGQVQEIVDGKTLLLRPVIRDFLMDPRRLSGWYFAEGLPRKVSVIDRVIIVENVPVVEKTWEGGWEV